MAPEDAVQPVEEASMEVAKEDSAEVPENSGAVDEEKEEPAENTEMES